MIIRNGIDIIDIRRIRKLINKYNFRFKKRCFSNEEINKSESRAKSVESYAKRYAAKEACSKALEIDPNFERAANNLEWAVSNLDSN